MPVVYGISTSAKPIHTARAEASEEYTPFEPGYTPPVEDKTAPEGEE